jgi:hypothetical protein
LKDGKRLDRHPPRAPTGAPVVEQVPYFGNEKNKSPTEKGFPFFLFFSFSQPLEEQRRSRVMMRGAKLYTICNFCMIFVALIPVLNYNAQIAFKKTVGI